jgi:hypothetical protein
MLAKMDAKADANVKEIKEDMKTNQTKADANLKETNGEMIAKTDSQLEKMKFCLGKTEATDLEAHPEERESEAVHEEVPKEEAAVQSVVALKKRHGDRNLAVGCRRKPKKRTQGNGGSRKKFAATGRGMNRRVIPARRKGHGHQGPGRDNVARGAPGGRTLKRRRRTRQKGSDRIGDRDVKEQLRLRKERTTGNGIRGRRKRQQLRLESTGNFNDTFRETLGLDIAKRIDGTSIRLRKMSDWTLRKGRPPPKRKNSWHTE